MCGKYFCNGQGSQLAFHVGFMYNKESLLCTCLYTNGILNSLPVAPAGAVVNNLNPGSTEQIRGSNVTTGFVCYKNVKVMKLCMNQDILLVSLLIRNVFPFYCSMFLPHRPPCLNILLPTTLRPLQQPLHYSPQSPKRSRRSKKSEMSKHHLVTCLVEMFALMIFNKE